MSSPTAESGLKCIIHFAQFHLDFRMPEFEAVTSMYGVKYEIDEPLTPERPFAILRFTGENPRDDVARVCSRCVLIYEVYEFVAVGDSIQDVADQCRPRAEEITRMFLPETSTWAFDLLTFGRKMSLFDKRDSFEKLSFLAPKFGTVDLKHGEKMFMTMYHYGENSKLTAPARVFLGMLLHTAQRQLPYKYTLKKRPFLGPTSMDAELALIMGNMGRARPGSFTLDPFVGTGSILVAATHWGSTCVGTDLDIKIIGAYTRHGVRREKNILTNFDFYHLPRPSIGWADMKVNIWSGKFDSIICDPPYGLRAFVKTVDSGAAKPKGETPSMPRNKSTSIANQMVSLLAFAASHLTVGGRIVFWLPVIVEFYTEADLPTHPALRLVSNCFQELTEVYGRRLITMEKVREAAEGDEAAVMAGKSYDNFGKVVRHIPVEPTHEGKRGRVD
ncbi:N6 adenine-specific DNA methyltransferase, N12 class [Carpediemonas membranifera]|uniref:N6 adenine-specific DNA methyltransferase, N12 class n=1 Tax=Carpediemonas membranifera TaxID=201153 RepID=A0A8J6E8K5_9EUKA|nr:N6 adenine-specific DNA methyltransferase, N12 class [Carpediemonas membranifera]|eukprot:KAG9392035.1 N6 adenine-specific DNA methyltransferase, N12 class [Carpediemonas membranifera]